MQYKDCCGVVKGQNLAAVVVAKPFLLLGLLPKVSVDVFNDRMGRNRPLSIPQPSGALHSFPLIPQHILLEINLKY